MGKENFPKRGLQRTDGPEGRVEGLERTRGQKMVGRHEAALFLDAFFEGGCWNPVPR